LVRLIADLTSLFFRDPALYYRRQEWPKVSSTGRESPHLRV